MVKRRCARFVLATSALALAGAAQGDERVAYSYDALGRLIATTNSGTVNSGIATSLGYDSAGNRLCYKVGGAAVSCPPPPPAPAPGPPPASQQPSVISVAAASASEGSPLVFTVSKTGTAAATVSWSYSDGTAKNGLDFTANSGLVSFAAGESTKTIAVQTLADSLVEGSETMTVQLYSPTGASLGAATATGTISDIPPPNHNPTPVNDVVAEQVLCTIQVYNVTTNDTDPDGDTLTLQTTTSSSDFEVVSASEIQFTARHTGLNVTSYTVEDPRGGTGTATLSVSVPSNVACSHD
jgi:Calx-beta domain/Bacterial Ig domain